MKICPEHEVAFSAKSPNSRGFYWHVIDFNKNEFCSKTEEEYNAIPDEQEEVREPVEQTYWDEVARGKIRSLFIEAKITRDRLVALTDAELIVLDKLVEIAMGRTK